MWCLLEISDNYINVENLIIIEGTYEDCLNRYIQGEHMICHRDELHCIS